MRARWLGVSTACLGLVAAGIWVGTRETTASPRATTPEATSTAPATSTTTTSTLPTTAPPATTATTATSATSTSTTSSTTSSTTTTVDPSRITDEQWAVFDQAVRGGTVDRGAFAVSIAVVHDGEVLHAAAYGHENAFTGTTATPSTMFRLASISKLLTANAVLQLVQRGDIDLDEPFLDQLGRHDAADPRVAAVTVRQLLNHTSGFPKAYAQFFGGAARDWRDATEQALRSPLMFDPGTAWQYSNTNYTLLGLLLEHVTGHPFDEAIDELVLQPLGVTGMRLAGTFDTRPGEALYASTPGRNYMEALGPAGGWVGTAADMARLLDTLDTDDLDHGWHPLTARTISSMTVPQAVIAPGSAFNYGLGLLLYPDGSWGHSGTIEQAHTMVIHRPDGYTVAVFVDGDVPKATDKLLTLIDAAVIVSGI